MKKISKHAFIRLICVILLIGSFLISGISAKMSIVAKAEPENEFNSTTNVSTKYNCPYCGAAFYSEKEYNAHVFGECPVRYPENESTTGFVTTTNPQTVENIYNLGEETYSFDNFKDYHASGHCFGMSVTSSGYYTGKLDISEIGGSSSKPLYSLTQTFKVTNPICKYQKIQGYVERESIVAGGSMDIKNTENIKADWESCVNYVKNHNYDDKGILNIGMWYSKDSGHAVNFLYYKEVDGQQRIYAYDNNFPEIETYFYMGSDGYVHQAPKQTLESGIIGFDLMDTGKYFSLTSSFDFKRYIYADKNEIKIDGAQIYNMKSDSGSSSDVMYEIPENATEIYITPLTDNASFEYNNNRYSFEEVNEKTCGVIEIPTKTGATQEPVFKILNAPDNKCSVSIKTPSTTTINYGDSIILHSELDGALPTGARIEWTADNGNFSMSVSSDGSTCKISPKSNGKTVFTVTVYDKDGKIISTDSQEMSAKAGLWQKIVAFFKKIFGLTKTIPEAFKSIL